MNAFNAASLAAPAQIMAACLSYSVVIEVPHTEDSGGANAKPRLTISGLSTQDVLVV